MDARLIDRLKIEVEKETSNPKFIHLWWFVKYHLEIVEKISFELCEIYPNADKNFVLLLVWLHDYGKIVDHKNQYKATLSAGREKLLEMGFSEAIVEKTISSMKIFDGKIDLEKEAIEIQIVSSADGASHLVGPFYEIFWKEFHEWTYEALLKENRRKALVDWEKKIVLPEVKKAFSLRHKFLMEQLGDLPTDYLSD